MRPQAFAFAQVALSIVLTPLLLVVSLLLLIFDKLRGPVKSRDDKNKPTTDPAAVPRTVAITDASSSPLTRALAMSYASLGSRLYLCGKHDGQLRDLAEDCLDEGAKSASWDKIDLSDPEDVDEWITRINKEHRVDLLIVHVSELPRNRRKDTALASAAASWRAFSEFPEAVFNCVPAMLAHMRKRGSGQVAVLTSMDAVAPSTATKPSTASGHAAVITWMRALRASPPYRDGRVGLSVVHAGDDAGIQDDIVAFEGTMALNHVTAAETVVEALRRRDAVVVLPARMYLFRVMVERVVPEYLVDKLGIGGMLIGRGGDGAPVTGDKSRAVSFAQDSGDARGIDRRRTKSNVKSYKDRR